MGDDDERMRALMEKLSALAGDSSDSECPHEHTRPSAEHAFWSTQPVTTSSFAHVNGARPCAAATTQHACCSGGEPMAGGAAGPIRGQDDFARDAVPLPADMHWATVDIECVAERTELFTLLRENYVEDADALFRFDYSPAFLEWALRPPGHRAAWLVGIRLRGSLVAFISAVPLAGGMRVAGTDTPGAVAEVNFLCVHKRLRAQRLAPLLIREITRRATAAGVFQAVYTAGAALPGRVATARYYHRPLDYAHLVATGFAQAPPPGMALADMARRYELPACDSGEQFDGSNVNSEYSKDLSNCSNERSRCSKDLSKCLNEHSNCSNEHSNCLNELSNCSSERSKCPKDLSNGSSVRLMNAGDVPAVCALLSDFLARFSFAPRMCKEEVAHWLLPREGVVHTYVRTDARNVPAAFVSFYELPSLVVRAEAQAVRAAYLFYYAAEDEAALVEMVGAALCRAAAAGMHVFNCVDVMWNWAVLRPLRFAEGDGVLHYYIYNWRAPTLSAADVGLVML